MKETPIFTRYFVNPLRRLCFKIYQYFYPPPTLPSDPAQLSPIYRLSCDVVYYLGNVILPPADGAAFALAGKGFWISLDGQNLLKRLERHMEDWKHAKKGKEQRVNVNKDRMDFLQRLQVRYPKRLLCYVCGTFHRRRQWTLDFNKCATKRATLRYHRADPILSFISAQEVLNWCQYGDGYGCPPSDVEYNFELSGKSPHYRGFFCGGWRERRSFSVRVVNDELFVKIDHSRLFLPEDPKTRATAMELLRYAFLSHRVGEPWWNRRNELMKGEAANLLYRCSQCNCELRCIIDPDYDERFGEVWISMWLTLGGCRGPYDSKWRRATEQCPLGGDRSYRIDPAESLYLQYFDDLSPHKVRTKGSYYLMEDI